MTSVVIPAAGAGTRLGSSGPKALFTLGGKPLIQWVCDAVAHIATRVIVVVRPDQLDAFSRWAESYQGCITWSFQCAPTGSLDAVIAGLSTALNVSDDDVLIVWADQVGASREVVEKCAELVGSEPSAIVVPLAECHSPYVWIDLDDDRIVAVHRVRDGDITPEQGLADVGVFGVSLAMARLIVECGDSVIEKSDREPDFTYLLPWLSTRAHRTLTPRVTDRSALLAVNTAEDFFRASQQLAKP